MKKENKIIAVFSPLDIFSGNAGNQQDIRNRLEIFQEMGFEVHLFQFTNNNRFETFKKNELNIYVIPKSSGKGFYKSQGLFSKKNADYISKIISDLNPTCLWFEYLSFVKLAEYLHTKFPEKPIYFRSHNFEILHNFEKLIFRFKQSFDLRLLFDLLKNSIYLFSFERRMLRISEKIFSISLLDIKKFKTFFPFLSRKVFYLPFYDSKKAVYRMKNNHRLKGFYLGGDLSVVPNEQGLQSLTKYFALINKYDLDLYIIGKNFPMNVQKKVLKYNNIFCHKFIPDLSTFFKTMDFAIIPIDIGYGMKIKVYEALSNGIPLITTSRSDRIFHGFKEKAYLVYRNKDEFEKAIVYLKEAPNRATLSENATAFMKKKFSKKNIIDIVDVINT